MQILVRFFGPLAESVGLRDETIDVPEGGAVTDLLQEVSARHPGAGRLSGGLAVAVNYEYVALDHILSPRDEVALIPPVSGGAGGGLADARGSEDRAQGFVVTRETIDPEALTARVCSASKGAAVTFLGMVRDNADGRAVTALEYEAYEEMARAQLARVGAEVVDRWPDAAIAIAHRFGLMHVGEVSLVVAVATPHRREGFLACGYAVDRIKQTVPIWKREHGPDGSTWVAGEVPQAAPPVSLD